MPPYVWGLCMHPVCTKSYLNSIGLGLSDQPFSSCRPLARPMDSNLPSCDTSAFLKVRPDTSSPCGQWIVCMLASWQNEQQQGGNCLWDYVGTGRVIASYYIPLLLHLSASSFTSWTGKKKRYILWLHFSVLSGSTFRPNSRIHPAYLPIEEKTQCG